MDIKLELTTHHPADDWESNVRGGVTPQAERVLCPGKYNHLSVSREMLAFKHNLNKGVTPQAERVRNRAANLLSLRDISPIG